MKPEEQWHRLLRLLQHHKALAIACSGGFDSRFLAHAAQCAKIPFILLHIRGAHIPAEETKFVMRWATQHNFTLHVIDSNPLVIDQVASNTPQRCYYCKQHIFSVLQRHVATLSDASYVLCDGSNASDMDVHRPGMKALQELGVLSPLAEAGLHKNVMRQLGVALAMPFPLQKARPCLLTRFPYGAATSLPVLRALEEAERSIGSSLYQHYGKSIKMGAKPVTGRAKKKLEVSAIPAELEQDPVPDFRVRLTPHPNNPLGYNASIHMNAQPSAHLEKQLLQHLSAAGFTVGAVHTMDIISGFYDAPERRLK